MLPNMLLRSFRAHENSREKKTNSRCKRSSDEELMEEEWQHQVYSLPFNRDSLTKHSNFSLRSQNSHNRSGGLKKSMASKMSNFSHLIQRVAASCLLHHQDDSSTVAGENYDYQNEEAEEDESNISSSWEKDENEEQPPSRIVEIEMLMGQVFDAVSSMKRAYISLQKAHCPWDPNKMRIANVAVVAEIRRLGLLRERFRHSIGGEMRPRDGSALLRDMMALYETSVEELKREVKIKQEEVENLREKLKTATSCKGKSKGRSKRRVSCTTQVAAAPAFELFEATMMSVKEASKSFTSLLLSLMKSAHWDIAAAVRSIEVAFSKTTFADSAVIMGPNHGKYALESYVNKKFFQGFSHESFYMDDTPSSILHHNQKRQHCFAQYCEMKTMDPFELLGILPTCSFGNFCFKKYLSIIHPKMEESLFGDLEQRHQVLDGRHPRSQFYGEFLELSKAVWLLHLLAFSLEPPPSIFETSRGAEFHSKYMESAVGISRNGGGAKVGVLTVVGFPVIPGFKLQNGSIIKAVVYLVQRMNEMNGIGRLDTVINS